MPTRRPRSTSSGSCSRACGEGVPRLPAVPRTQRDRAGAAFGARGRGAGRARGGARRVEPEAQVQAVERGLARYRRGYGHAVVALGYGAGIESQRCGAAVHRHRHQMRRIAHVVVARHNPAGWRHLHAGAVAVKGLLPRCSHTVALPLRRHRQGCHKHHQHRQSQHPATELLMCCQYLHTINHNARVCEILCRPSLFLFTAQRLHP